MHTYIRTNITISKVLQGLEIHAALDEFSELYHDIDENHADQNDFQHMANS
jgi:hypothetical protein